MASNGSRAAGQGSFAMRQAKSLLAISSAKLANSRAMPSLNICALLAAQSSNVCRSPAPDDPMLVTLTTFPLRIIRMSPTRLSLSFGLSRLPPPSRYTKFTRVSTTVPICSCAVAVSFTGTTVFAAEAGDHDVAQARLHVAFSDRHVEIRYRRFGVFKRLTNQGTVDRTDRNCKRCDRESQRRKEYSCNSVLSNSLR